MPCNICNSILIEYENKLTCPKCQNLKVLDVVTSITISDKIVDIFQKLWNEDLKKIEQSSLLLHITAHREMLSRKYFKEYNALDIDKLFSDTLFLKRVIQNGNPDGTIIIDSVQKAQPIIELFNTTKKVETDSLLIKSCYAVLLYSKEFELESLSSDDVLTNFTICHTEDYLKLMRSYENYGLYPKEKGEQKIAEYKKKFKKTLEKKPNPVTLTREEYVKRNYDVISSYYLVFIRNELYSKVFDLQHFRDLMLNPSRLFDFFNRFPFDPRGLTQCDTTKFLSESRKFFKKSPELVKKILLFDNENQDAFPLFIRVKNNKYDFVVFSQTFAVFMYVLLHAVITRDLFIAETNNRGKIFEEKVKERFETLGFSYKPNVKDDLQRPTLEIDGIALKNERCVVIECKNSRLPLITESSEARKIMIDDLKGIVDGYKREVENGQRIKKPIKKLSEKVAFVKNRLTQLGISKISPENVKGIIITKDIPLMSRYKDIEIMSYDEISNERLNS